MKTNNKDITGQKIGLLTAVCPTEKRYRKSIVWILECDCGNFVEKSLLMLREAQRENRKISCGCYIGIWQISHNQSKSIEYKTWASMKSRCLNNKHSSYKYYGGRGITVCEDWMSSFESFLRDMGKCPGENYSIDRIDNNGNYEPSNCRWVTKTTQVINRRTQCNNKSGVRGVCWDNTNKRWLASITVNGKTKHLGLFKELEEAQKKRLEAEESIFLTLLQEP